MENILIVSDFIEGRPVVASVRFNDLMKHFSEDYNIFLMHNGSLDENKSIYSKNEILYYSSKSRFTQEIGKVDRKVSILEKLLRSPLILKVWRTYSYSQYKFNKLNKDSLTGIRELITKNDIKKVFITVPDIHGIYIGKFIRQNFKDIKIIYEIRDLINHKIGKGNPTIIFKKADKYIKESADGIIALSRGIKEAYEKMIKDVPITEIKNGYGEEFDYMSSKPDRVGDDKKITLSHIGSIYKGRNVGDLIRALNRYSEEKNTKVEFNIVGVLDKEAQDEIYSTTDVKHNGNLSINILGPVAHEMALKILFNCDIAIILTHKKGSGFAIPGKTYEYIGAEKPILAVSEDETLIDFIDGKYGFCSEHNVNDIYNKLDLILKTKFDFSDKNLYSRKEQYKKINNFIRQVLGEK